MDSPRVHVMLFIYTATEESIYSYLDVSGIKKARKVAGLHAQELSYSD